MSDDSRDFPDYALRGLPTQDCIDSIYGIICSTAFIFNGNHLNEKGYDEISINWYDTEEALNQLKNQIKEESGQPKYCFGVARIPTESMKKICKKYRNDLQYERKAIPDNEYHGNILLKKEALEKVRRNMIASELASSVDMLHKYNVDNKTWSWKRFEY